MATRDELVAATAARYARAGRREQGVDSGEAVDLPDQACGAEREALWTSGGYAVVSVRT